MFLEIVGGKGKKGNVWSQGDLGSLLLSQSSPSSTAHTAAPTDREIRMERQLQDLTVRMEQYSSERESLLQMVQTASLAAERAAKAAEDSQRAIQELRDIHLRPPPPPSRPAAPSSSSTDDLSSDGESDI